MKLGIIGTAGRGNDASILNDKYWRLMNLIANNVKILLQCDTLVSGGAAWSDSIATRLFIEGKAKNLILHLPAPFGDNKFFGNKTADIANYYHEQFGNKLDFYSLGELASAIDFGALVKVGKGFKERNTDIARDSDYMLAFTFGNGPILKDGGTNDTMTKFLKLKKGHAFHFDLNSRELFEIS